MLRSRFKCWFPLAILRGTDAEGGGEKRCGESVGGVGGGARGGAAGGGLGRATLVEPGLTLG
jgi:hypothetical protein